MFLKVPRDFLLVFCPWRWPSERIFNSHIAVRGDPTIRGVVMDESQLMLEWLQHLIHW